MSKRLKIYIGGFILVIGLMMYMEYTKPKPIDWTPSYSTKDKIPLGTYILRKEISKLFPEKSVTTIEETPFSFFIDNDEAEEDNVYFIIDESLKLSEADEKALLSFVEAGNDVFIVSKYIPPMILDSLQIDTGANNYILEQEYSSVESYLTNPVFKNKKYKFEKITDYPFFSKLNDHSVILGEYKEKENVKVNFIKQKFGNGYFYLNLLPEGYSNYFMLNDDTYTYAVNSLNYIDKKNILWDENNKSIHTSADGILKYIFNNPSLHWAWIILILSFLVYCLFFGKRLQRIIPIIKPLKNTTVDFTKTIGNLYFNSKQPQNIIKKKIKYFLYFVKEHYFVNIENPDEEFSEKLHLKSGVSKEITDKIVYLIQKERNSGLTTEDDLKNINTTIDLFYKKIK